MAENLALKQYYEMFDELPFLLTTQSYDSEDYQLLMMIAVRRGTPLEEKEIAEFFKDQYDLVNNSKQFSNFKKQ